MRLLTPEALEEVKGRFAPKLLEIESIGWSAWVRPLTLGKTIELRDQAFGAKSSGDREAEWTYMLQVFAATLCRADGSMLYTSETVASLRDLLTWEEALVLSDEIGKANRLGSKDVADTEKNSASSPSGDSSSP